MEDHRKYLGTGERSVFNGVLYSDLDSHFSSAENRQRLFAEFADLAKKAGYFVPGESQPSYLPVNANTASPDLLRGMVLDSLKDENISYASKIKRYSKALRVSLESALEQNTLAAEVTDLPSFIWAAFDFVKTSAEALIDKTVQRQASPTRNERHLLMDAASIAAVAADHYLKLHDDPLQADTAAVGYWYGLAIPTMQRSADLSGLAAQDTTESNRLLECSLDKYNAYIELFSYTNTILNLELHRIQDQEVEYTNLAYYSNLVYLSDRTSRYIITAFELRATNLLEIQSSLGISEPRHGKFDLDEVDEQDAWKRYKKQNSFLIKRVEESAINVNQVAFIVNARIMAQMQRVDPKNMSVQYFTSYRDDVVNATLAYTRLLAVKEAEVIPSLTHTNLERAESMQKMIAANIVSFNKLLNIISYYKSLPYQPLPGLDEKVHGLPEILAELKGLIPPLERFRFNAYPDSQPNFKYVRSLLTIVAGLAGSKSAGSAEKKPGKTDKKKKR